MRRPHWVLIVAASACVFVFSAALRTTAAQDAPATSPTTEPTAAPASQPANYLTAQPGELPILITAPHGGRLRIPGVESRTGANMPAKRGAKNNFSIAFDRNTDQLAFALADEIEQRTGKRPYLIVAHFTRRHIDANRTAEEAYENPRAGLLYDQYHGAIQAFRNQILKDFGRGLMIDLHGHGGDPLAIIRGTADGQTVRNLITFHGKDALTGPDGLLGPLEAAGHKVVPPHGSEDRENPSLNGGFTVREYGSFRGGSFDAVQFELGMSFRRPETIPGFASDLADATVGFANRYLMGPATRPASPATGESAGESATPPAKSAEPARD